MRLRRCGDFPALLLRGDQFLEAVVKFVVMSFQVEFFR